MEHTHHVESHTQSAARVNRSPSNKRAARSFLAALGCYFIKNLLYTNYPKDPPVLTQTRRVKHLGAGPENHRSLCR